MDIILFIPELFHAYQYDMLNNLIICSNEKNYTTVCIYHDDTMYTNIEINENQRIHLFNKYMMALSHIDIIIPNSKYSLFTYDYHLNRLNLQPNKCIKSINLAGQFLNVPKIVKTKFGSYIFANIHIYVYTQKTCICTYVRTYIFTYKHVYRYIYHIHVCIYLHKYIHIYTYIHRYI